MESTQTIVLSALAEKYQQRLARLKKYWLIVLIMSLPTFILIPFILAQFFQVHWFTSLLLIVIAGCWSTLLGQIISLTVFLHGEIKNLTEHVTRNDSVINFLEIFWKNLKRKTIIFSLMSGSFIFWIFLLLWQPEDGETLSIGFDDIIGVIFAFSFISAFAFKISNFIIKYFLKIQSNSQHNALSSLEDFQEFQSSSNKSSLNEPPQFHSTDKVWNNWDHDPMNPASAEHQSTYQRWNHDT
jgi:hypothetical protein